MKKLILSAVAIAASLNLMAATKATVNITMSGENSTATLLLVESDNHTSALESGYDAPAAPGAAMYAYLGGNSLSKCWTNNLEEVEIRFAAAGTYTLTFSGVTGRALKFNDQTVGNGESMTVTVTAEEVGKAKIAIADAATPATPNICHRYGKLEVTGSNGMTVQVLNLDGTATSIADQVMATDNETINLSGLDAGKQYLVKWNGKELIIQL